MEKEKISHNDEIEKQKIPRIQNELSSCGFGFEILGLQYFSLRSLNYEEKPTNPTLFRGVIFFLYAITLTTLMGFYILADRSGEDEGISAKTILTYLIQHSMRIGMVVVIVISVVQSFISTKNLKKIFINVRKITEISAADFQVMVDFKKIRKNLKQRAAAVVLFFFISHGVLLIMESSSIDKVTVLLIGLFPNIYLFSTVYKFVFYVEMINKQLEFLKNLIEGIFQNYPSKMIEDLNLHVMPVKAMKVADNAFKKFISAKKIYNILYENAALINESMGLTILILLIVIVISLTASGYQIFVILVEGKSKEKIPESMYVLLVGIVLLISIVSFCQRTQLIMTRIATIVSKIECENYEQLTEESREFVHKFYMQLNHQPILFTAYGFYTINLSLLASITTGVVSYQIILVQFYAT